MQIGALLVAQTENYGARLGLERGRLYVEPRSAVPRALFTQLRCHKREVLAVLLVRQALSNGNRKTGRELRRQIDLPVEDLYAALGSLYDSGELRTNPAGFYWLEELVH